ncbi:MATE family efflux transporter [Pseudohalioglobus lutimaris]|uniref:MATE family efflux transporter n=1 Tax=Pseudohalioglobus lutimaris TaxID=1737061 RepID=A0A2N5X8Q6_9GAMM|nr:MATE family efflux transporter [Pseudohalioglobus lutimaris]PLW70863.1 MATE family efflux transporter [Pseudohalioglobus lutimaris]
MQSNKQLDHKIWGIAWPAILSNISIPMLGLVDSAILGHLDSSNYLGAVAIGAALLSFLYWGFSFLRMGTTGLVARAEGAGDNYRSILILARSSVLALGLAALILLCHQPLISLGLWLMAPDAELQPLTASYAGIRIYSAPAVLVTYTVVGWFIGRQDTRWPMVIVIITNLTNIALDFLLIMGLGLYSDGAAIATVCAEYLGCAIALFAVFRKLPPINWPDLAIDLTEANAYKHIMQSNRHLFVRTLCLLFSFAFFTAQGENLGTEVLAANTLMMQLMMMAAYGMDGFAFAAEGLCGQSLGAGQLQAFHRTVRRCALWTAIAAGTVSFSLWSLQLVLVDLLTGLDSVKELMLLYFPWLIVLPLAAGPSYLLDGIFIGAAETHYMMSTMLLSVSVIYLPLWYLTLGMGNHGLWLAFTAFNLARGLTLFYWFARLTREQRWLPANQS